MIDATVSQYLKQFPDERAGLAVLIEQIVDEDDLCNRKTLPGHITGAAFVLSPDKTKLLLIKHKILQTWFQPGGHWDPADSDPLVAAMREVEEETAVKLERQLVLDPALPLVPLDIDTHLIPANPDRDEPKHYHHDFRYAFVASTEEFVRQASEVDEVKWFDLNSPECLALGKTMQKLRYLL